MSTNEHKRGKASKEEMDFISKNSLTMTVKDISAAINRSEEFVLKYMDINSEPAYDSYSVEDKEIIKALHAKPFWKDVKKQWDDHERELYEYHWVQYTNQLGTDVTHAEGSQVCRAIELELMMGRLLNEKISLKNQITKLKERNDYYWDKLKEAADAGDDEEVNKIEGELKKLDYELGSVRSSEGTFTKDYNTLADRQAKILENLKMTRDQRLKDIQDKKTNVLDWLKQFSDPTFLSRISREMELDRLSKDKEIERLGKNYDYADGTVDRPFLNADTIEDEDKYEG